MVVLTKESVRTSHPAAEALVRVELTRALADGIDLAFLDPDNGGAPDTPASVTAGVTPIPSTGSAAGDIATLLSEFAGDLSAAVFITDPLTAAEFGLAPTQAARRCSPTPGRAADRYSASQ